MNLFTYRRSWRSPPWLGVVALFLVLVPASCSSSDTPARAASPALTRLLDTYFGSWSAGDMVTYRSLFHDKACIVAIVAGHAVYALGPDEFVQRQAHSQESAPLSERMTSVKAWEDSVAATARVTWELTGGAELIKGVDLFTLMRDHTGAWKITHLLFYQTD